MSSSQAIIGIDLGATNIKSLLMDKEGKILVSDKRPSLGNEGKEKVISQIISSIKTLQKEEVKLGISQFLGIGIGSPGPLNVEEGIIYQSPNIPGWQNVPLVRILEGKIHLPVFLENDANAAALGEWWKGAGKGFSYILLLTLGTGIGGGAIINGKVYRGARGCGMELGHMIIKEGGMICGCGARGCLEAYASATAVVKRAKAIIKQGHKSYLSQLIKDMDDLTCEDVFKAASKKDELALLIVEETARYLGTGIGNLLNIFNPDVVILAGGMVKAKEVLFNPVEKYTRLNCLKSCWEMVKIVPAKLGENSGAVGACATVLERKGII